MAIVFAYRTDQSNYDARYSPGHKTGTKIDPSSNISFVADAGAIGGVALDFANSTNQKRVVWSGHNNSPNGAAISITIRAAPMYSGTPAGRRALFSLSNAAQRPIVSLWHHTTGDLVAYIFSGGGIAIANILSLGAFNPTSGTYYDLTLTWPGTTAANGIKAYVNNTLNGQGTASVAMDSGITNKYMNSLSIGGDNQATVGLLRVNEIVIQDAVIDPTANVSLESGAGLLNGSSRTSFISDVSGQTLTSFDGLNSTDPGVANVLTSAGTYYINGAAKTPTYVDVGAATNVKTGVSYGVGLTGSYDGSDRYTDPDLSKIDSAYSFKYNTTGANNRTGTATIPSLANTKTGVAGYGGTGTYDGSDRWTDPGEANVANGVQYKANSTTNNKTGTLSSVTNNIQRMSGNANRFRLKGVVR